MQSGERICVCVFSPYYLDFPYSKHRRLGSGGIEERGPEVREKNSCSNQLSMKFLLLINVKIVGIYRTNSIIGSSEPEKC